MTTTRPLHEIAAEIIADYRSRNKPVHWSAVPYVEAMTWLTTLDDRYGEDPGDHVVMYALSNLTTWRGETARRVKAELNAMLDARSSGIHSEGIIQ